MKTELLKKEFMLLLIFFSLIFLFANMPIMWDELVYNLNAKYFLGLNDFYDNFRPPIYSLILAPFYALNFEFLLSIVPKIFLILLITVTYFLSKHFTKNPFFACLFLLSFPVIIYWSNSFMTSIPATFFILLSIIFLKKYEKMQKFIYLALSFTFCALTFLTRYPLGLIYGIIVLLYLIFIKDKKFNHFILSQLFFFIPILFWINKLGIDLFISIFNAAASQIESPLFFLINYFLILGISGLLIPLVFKKKFKKKDLWIIIPIFSFLSFFQIFKHKETRFLIPILPFIAIMLSRIKIKKLLIYLTIILSFTSALYFIVAPSRSYYTVFNSAFNQVSEFFIDKPEKVILSNMVAYCLYYTKNSCILVSWEPKDFMKTVNETNASYILISDNAIAHPYYSSNQSYYDDYILEKRISIGLENIYIYGVKK
jgi:4-amino-4-deoxy-L-arabinose transferase-like glycosyltransferase